MSAGAVCRDGTGHHIRSTVRFFWVWLIVATGTSLAGNVTHAVLTAPANNVALAAAAALVPPVVLLGWTHSAALLIKIRAWAPPIGVRW